MYIDQCKITEVYEPIHGYNISGHCKIMNTPYTVFIEGSELFKLNQGELIQNACPNMSVDDREFLISGLSPEGYDTIFK